MLSTSLFDRFIPSELTAPKQRAEARLVVALALAGLPVWVCIAVYHLVGIEVALPITAATVVLAVGSTSVPVILRRTGSTKLAGLTLAGVGFVGINLLAYLNGGQPFHVLMWSMLLPLAIPADAEWRPLFWLALLLCIAQYVSFFLVTLLGAGPPAVIQHSEDAKVIACAVSLGAVLGMISLISRTSSRVTYAHIDERDHYQRALLQSQKLNSLGRLADALVHDFNNVLMAMDYAVHLLSSTLGDEGPRSEELDELDLAMDRAKGLARQLERFGNDEGTAQRAVDIDEAVAQLEKIAQRAAGLDVRTCFDLGAGGAHALLDPCQLDQIIVNLLVNANDAMEDGGELTISTRRAGDEVVIEVCDTGSGIPDSIRERLFEPFFTTKSADCGTGLGLWISRSAARDAGGDLVAESVPGHGTAMRLRLPIVEPCTSASSAIHRYAPTMFASPRRPEPGTTGPAILEHLFGWFVTTVRDRRVRLWAMVICALAIAGISFWLGFAAWYWTGLDAPATAIAMACAAGLTGLVPLILRFTRSVYFAGCLLAAIILAGLALIAIARGGFPLPVLSWILVIPLVAAMQKEYRSLSVLAAAACLIYIGVFTVLAITGAGPAAAVVLTSTEEIVEGFAVLIALLLLLTLARRAGHWVDDHVIAERDDFLRALVQSQRLETLGTFASSIAHDLNNVLMSFEFSTILLEGAFAEDDPARNDILELRSACDRVRSLSRRLVRFGRNDDVVGSEVDVDSAVLELESMVRPLLGRHIELSAELDSERARSPIAAKRLDQLLLNLMLNARDSMPDGGSLIIATRSTNAEVIVDVRDDGSGIADDVVDHVFDPFFTTGADDAKTGLGLWVCQSIVGDVGGSLEIATTSPRGTTMRVRLPRACSPGGLT